MASSDHPHRHAPSMRRRFYLLLTPEARDRPGLTAINRFLIFCIFAAAVFAVLETEPLISAGSEHWFRAAELAFGGVFAIEYLVRLWVAPEHPRFAARTHPRLRYALTPAAIIDLAAVIPMLATSLSGSSVVLRFFRVLRLLRLAKLGRMSAAWRHVADAVHSRRHELLLTAGLGAALMLVSATMLYWAEGAVQPDKFGSIPRALWWSAVTLTTVGYGDVYPITPFGQFLSACVAVLGIGVIALPTGILAAAFSDGLQRHRSDRANDS